MKTDILDANGIEVYVGNYVKMCWGSAAFDDKYTDIYHVHKIILHKGEFLLGNPGLENANYNIWEGNEVEVIDEKYWPLCIDGLNVDKNLNILGCPDAFRSDK